MASVALATGDTITLYNEVPRLFISLNLWSFNILFHTSLSLHRLSFFSRSSYNFLQFLLFFVNESFNNIPKFKVFYPFRIFSWIIYTSIDSYIFYNDMYHTTSLQRKSFYAFIVFTNTKVVMY